MNEAEVTLKEAFEPESGPGAGICADGRTRLRVWAPQAGKVEVSICGPGERRVELRPEAGGYFSSTVEDLPPGTRYRFRLDGKMERPDPASRYQPNGVHGPSEIVDLEFAWNDREWSGLPLEEYVIYELHVGTFTPEGTFDAVISRLDELVELGVTAVELMPVAQFPGRRNWGYDGVYPYAVQNSYGGPGGLQELVDACHSRGLAVILDVVYNHLGPEGNYLADFGPYFTDRYRTPWGQAVNFDGRGSDEVSRFFLENALYWVRMFHVDALRLDAVHAIYDFSARPFLQRLSEAVEAEGARLGRPVHLIAESSLNDVRILYPREQGGLGLSAQWNDDFHHSLHRTMTGESDGYYQDYRGFSDLVKSFRDTFVLDGRFSRFRGRRHGNSATEVDPRRFVVFAQNHDQVGNRAFGERLSLLTPARRDLRFAAAVTVLSPYLPLLFMGEEYGETAPFYYFVDHSDPQLVEAVRRGRREEFETFRWQEQVPDPQSEETFERSRLDHSLKEEGENRRLREFYRALLRLRKDRVSYRRARRSQMSTRVFDEAGLFCFSCGTDAEKLRVLFCVPRREGEKSHPKTAGPSVASRSDALLGEGSWIKLLDSEDSRWGGEGSALPEEIAGEEPVNISMCPASVVVYSRVATDHEI